MIGLLALVAALTGTPAPTVVHHVLDDERYRFCHDPRYPLDEEEQAWCPLVGETNAACPALPEACKAASASGSKGRVVLDFGGTMRGSDRRDRSARRGRGRNGRGSRDGEAGQSRGCSGSPMPSDDESPSERGKRERERDQASFELPTLGGLARVLFFALIAALVVVVARAIAKNVLASRGDDSDDPAPPQPDAPRFDEAKARGPVETDVTRLLDRARAAAARGDFARALDDTYAALLRRLDGDGLIDIHPSRTNGDYLRSLRARPDVRVAVRDILADVERVQFGATAPSETVFRAVFDRVVPLVSRALTVALLCFGLSAALSCSPVSARATGADSGDVSPSGTQALVDVLDEHGIHAHHRQKRIDELHGEHTLLLLEGADLDEKEWDRVLAWVERGEGSVVVAGAFPLPAHLDIEREADTTGDATVTVASAYRDVTPALALSIPNGGVLQELPDSAEAALLRGATTVPYASRIRLAGSGAGGQILVFADHLLFTNIALTVAENASFLVAALDALPHDVEIVDEWTGAGAETPLDAVKNARLLPVMLQLLALLTLLFLWKGIPFARLRDPITRSRRAFSDHARALGLAYARAHASRHVLGLYTSWALDRLREGVPRSGRHGLISLAEAIAARTGRKTADIMTVLVEATTARDESAPPSFRHRDGPANPPPVAAPPSQRSFFRRAPRATERDLELMRELQSFLAATGGGRSNAKNPAARP